MFFETSIPLDSFSPNTLACTTPISYSSSVENLIDQFQFSIFQALFPEEYKKRSLLLNCITECNQKLKEVDILLKKNGKSNDFLLKNKILNKNLIFLKILKKRWISRRWNSINKTSSSAKIQGYYLLFKSDIFICLLKLFWPKLKDRRDFRILSRVFTVHQWADENFDAIGNTRFIIDDFVS